jgi:hypothetical protein
MLDHNLIATSPAHDYMHRSEQLQALSLYQWSHSYHKVSLSQRHAPIDTEDPSLGPASNSTGSAPPPPPTKSFRFLSQHPLYNTHGCLPYPNPQQNVVNFIGGVLPRPDQADRDHYCATMLVLFKPWRSGKDLKTMPQSWENAFEAHNFMPQEQQIIKNFNIRYECLDAHDDYHAQLKAGHIQPTLNIWDNNDFSSEINSDPDHPETSIEMEPHIDETSLQAIIDNNEMISIETNRIRSILHHTGWNNVSALSQNLPLISDLMPQTEQTRAQWKLIVQMEKDKQITKRMTCHHQFTPNTSLHDQDHAPNLVKLVDKHYLQHKYYTKSNLEMTHHIRSQFQLNKDQERSFNIITQHALLPNSEQLKLYIGGMGGTGKTRVINAISQFFTENGQASRFVVMAPTGTAAALLSGSTYHSLLGINDWKINPSEKKLAEIRNQILKADYFFLDEISMLSCRDLY